MDFSFRVPRIAFGVGSSAQLPGLAAGLGERPFVITGSAPDRVADALGPLASRPSGVVSGEPTIDAVRHLTGLARDAHADLVVAIGGGSVLDAGKAVAMLVGNGTDPMDHLEIVGAGHPITRASLPLIAVPTTAGTGSEATANAVLTSPDDSIKASLRSPSMIPTVALVDPRLTVSCPPRVTIDSGMDALVQCVEAFTTPFANPYTDGLSLQALGRVYALPRAVADGADLDARTDMSLVALTGGICLANAKLGAVHGIAGPLGGMTGVAHGALCAALLAATIEVNLRAMRDREPSNPALARYDGAALAVTGDPEASADTLVEWVRHLAGTLPIPGLEALGVDPQVFEEAAAKAGASSSMRGNPIALGVDELVEILERSR